MTDDAPNTENLTALLFELRLGATSVEAGLSVLALRTAAIPIKDELEILRAIARQWLESFEAFDEAMAARLTV